jgi:hypothetical protein
VSQLALAIISAAVGSIVTLFWEALLAPGVAARSLAEILSVDLSLHMQTIAAAITKSQKNPKSVPYPRPLPLGLYQGVSDRIGELPRDLVGPTLHLYQVFERLNQIAERADGLHTRLRELPDDSSQYEGLRDQLASEVALYSQFSENAIARIRLVQPKMIKAARPRWSPRFWFADKPRALDASELATRADNLHADHEARMRRLKTDASS